MSVSRSVLNRPTQYILQLSGNFASTAVNLVCHQHLESTKCCNLPEGNINAQEECQQKQHSTKLNEAIKALQKFENTNLPQGESKHPNTQVLDKQAHRSGADNISGNDSYARGTPKDAATTSNPNCNCKQCKNNKTQSKSSRQQHDKVNLLKRSYQHLAG